MKPEGYTSITVSDETIGKLTRVMTEYSCESLANAVKTASMIALQYDDAEWAQIPTDKLAD